MKKNVLSLVSEILDNSEEEPTNPPDWGPAGSAAASFASRINVENITHSFSGLKALDDVSFELPPGKIACLLGPSGCGKTTLMRIIAGIERPHSGRVLIDGEEVAGPNNFILPENRNIGLMFQDFALFPHLSILENVLFGLSHLDRSLAKTEASLALQRVGMTDYENSYPHMLSGGEQQRVALARAIAPRPAILLMDEPFSGLDHRLRDSVRTQTLKILKETGSSAIVVTHDPEEAMYMADSIILMRKGKIIQTGAPKELYNKPADASAARFFSDLNNLDGVVKKAMVETPLGKLKATEFSEGTQVEILIRPEAFLTDDKNGQEALVIEARFLGNYYLATIVLSGETEPMRAKIHGRQSLGIGEKIKLSLNQDQIFIFEKKKGHTS